MIGRVIQISTAISVMLIAAADWPVFRGNTSQTGYVAEALPDQLAIRWTFAAGKSIDGTAAIVGDTVYVGSMGGKLLALELSTGKEKWKFDSGPIKVAVGVHDGRVFVGNDDGIFHCVDVANGKSIWKFNTDAEVTSGPAFAGESVLFGCSDESLRCLSRSDGKEQWKFQVPGGPVMGTPLIVKDRVFISGCDRMLHAVDLAAGKELSQLELDGQVGSSPAFLDGHIYCTTMTGEVLAINAEKMTVEWRFESRRHAGFFASPAVTDRLIIASARDGRVYAIDRTTGKEAWSFLTGQRLDSSPVVAGQRVYFGSFDKQLHVLELANGKEVQALKLDGTVTASPAVGSHCLVIGTTQGTIYCLSGPKSHSN